MSGYVSLNILRQNYPAEVEKMINDQIKLELKAFYTYLSMVSASSAFVGGQLV